MKTHPCAVGLLCIPAALSAFFLWRALVPGASPLTDETALRVRGGQSGTCYVNFENSCTFAISNVWLIYGDTVCTGVPCQQVNAAGAYQCTYPKTYNSGGALPDYADCEDEGDMATNGYVGKVDGANYNCGTVDNCKTALNACKPGVWGAQLRCTSTLNWSTMTEPTCSPDAATDPCPSAMRHGSRLWSIAQANGIDVPSLERPRREAALSSGRTILNRATRSGA